MNPFALKTVFTLEEAACAVVGVVDYKDNRATVSAVERELEQAFPPIKTVKKVGSYGGSYKKEVSEPPLISREQLIAWCESKEINPPLLFPDKPPDTAEEAQYKEADLLATIYHLLLLLKDKDNEVGHSAKYSRKKYARGNGISASAVVEDIQDLLSKLDLQTPGLGSTKTRAILAAALKQGAAVTAEPK